MTDTATPLGELHVQEILTRLLNRSVPFRSWLLAQMGAESAPTRAVDLGAHAPGLQFIGARQSVHEADGETDIQVDWSRGTEASIEKQGDETVGSSDASVALRMLIEVKVNAAYQDRQGSRYRERAARIVAAGAVQRAIAVLSAPRSYIAASHAETRQFEVSIALEDILPWVQADDPRDGAALGEALRRAADAEPLGAKGLFPDAHTAVFHELSRRGLPFELTNHPTDWAFLRYPAAGAGTRFRYRIREGVVELRLNRSYPGDPSLPGVHLPSYIERLRRGTETIYRHRGVRLSPEARAGRLSATDVTTVAAALSDLAAWWRHRNDEMPPAAEVGA